MKWKHEQCKKKSFIDEGYFFISTLLIRLGDQHISRFNCEVENEKVLRKLLASLWNRFKENSAEEVRLYLGTISDIVDIKKTYNVYLVAEYNKFSDKLKAYLSLAKIE